MCLSVTLYEYFIDVPLNDGGASSGTVSLYVTAK